VGQDQPHKTPSCNKLMKRLPPPLPPSSPPPNTLSTIPYLEYLLNTGTIAQFPLRSRLARKMARAKHLVYGKLLLGQDLEDGISRSNIFYTSKEWEYNSCWPCFVYSSSRHDVHEMPSFKSQTRILVPQRRLNRSVPEASVANQTSELRLLKDSTVFAAEAEDVVLALLLAPEPVALEPKLEPTPEALDVALALAGRLESAGSVV